MPGARRAGAREAGGELGIFVGLVVFVGPVSGEDGGRLGLGAVGFEGARQFGLRVVFEFVGDAEEALHVAEGFFGDGELAEVVAPGVFAGAAARVGLTGDGADRTVGFSAEEGLVGDFEGHLLAGFPEAASEVVGEEQSIVAAFGGEDLDRFGGGSPAAAEATDVPASELESIAACLADEELKEFKACHGRDPIEEWV